MNTFRERERKIREKGTIIDSSHLISFITLNDTIPTILVDEDVITTAIG